MVVVPQAPQPHNGVRAAANFLAEQVKQQGHVPVFAAHHPRGRYLLVRCETCTKVGEVRYLATGAIAPESLRGEATTSRCHPEDGPVNEAQRVANRRLLDALCAASGPASREERTPSATVTSRIGAPIPIRQS